jgi:hypothetical protein
LLRTSRITFNPKRQMNCSNMEKNAQYRHKYLVGSRRYIGCKSNLFIRYFFISVNPLEGL